MWRETFSAVPAQRSHRSGADTYKSLSLSRGRCHGFTLIEIIIGFVIGAFAISLFTTLILPQLTRSAEPMFQVRAAELAQSILEEAASRRYDENSAVGGTPPCNSAGAPVCTASGSLGADAGETNRSNFDDIDDYHAFCGADNNVQDVFGSDITASGQFAGFSFRFCVDYDGDYDAVLNEAGATEFDAKLLSVTVTPPVPAIPLSISMYRSNY